jgi:hypothetical protein
MISSVLTADAAAHHRLTALQYNNAQVFLINSTDEKRKKNGMLKLGPKE